MKTQLKLKFRLLPGVIAVAVSILVPGAATAFPHAHPATTDSTKSYSIHKSADVGSDEVSGDAQDQQLALAVAAAEDESSDSEATGKQEGRGRIVIKTLEPSSGTDGSSREVPWLGLSTEETSEALAAQLGLKNGEGLTVNFVAPESPAAKAGLKKNDVLVKFEEHLLVHPAQLRKLVRASKEGESVQLTYYRAGKKETASVTVGKTKPVFGLDSGGGWEGNLRELKQQLKDLPIQPKIEEHLRTLQESLGNITVDHQKAQETLKHSLVEARNELQHALSQLPSVKEALEPTWKALKEIEKSRILKDNNASVTVRSSGDFVKSLVRSDDSGTLVIVANPNPRLTAHDKAGKLIFDGEIKTDEQRDKVPRDLWERVEPLLDQMNTKPENEE